MTTIKISQGNVDSYQERETATIDINDADYICIDDVVIKDDLTHGVKYETILRNEGGIFSPNWESSNMKILFILKESYILKDSFDNNDRGGHKMNTLYNDNNDDLWDNATYRNIVKISYYTFLSMNGMSSLAPSTNFKDHETWSKACDVFKNNVAVMSANPFPALAFNSTKTNAALLKRWLQIDEIKNQLKSAVENISPNIIYSGFDLGTVSSYSHLFGFLKERCLSELVDTNGRQSVLEHTILSGGTMNGLTYVIDDNHVPWIQGKHPSGRLSHKQMQKSADVISNLLGYIK